MQIGGIGTSTVTARFVRRDAAAPHAPEATSSARALVPVAAPAPIEQRPVTTRRPLATFLAQLIATQAQAPQTRARRRAEPEDVIALYAATSAPRRVARGKFERSA